MDTLMLDSLIEALDDMDAEKRATARRHLISMGSAAVDALITAMDSQRLRLSWQAAVVLGQIPDPRWIKPMTTALRSPNMLLAQAAVVALENLLGKEASPCFVACLPHSRLVVQIALVNALERLGDRQSVEPLLDVLRSTEIPELRYNVIQALGKIGDSSLIPILEQFVDDPNHHVRERVTFALNHLKQDR